VGLRARYPVRGSGAGGYRIAQKPSVPDAAVLCSDCDHDLVWRRNPWRGRSGSCLALARLASCVPERAEKAVGKVMPEPPEAPPMYGSGFSADKPRVTFSFAW
jgi:hypothetical protein